MGENITPVESSIGEYYDNYKQTQLDLILVYSKKTRKAIFTIAGLWLASELLGLAMANVFTTQALLSVSLVPVVLIAVAFLAMKQPFVAIIFAALVFVGVWTLTILAFGGVGAISGLLIKAIIIYFLIAGFQSAKEVTRIRKELA
jgi:hypothetical protein